ncbi:MAG: hydroxyacylglutathione hydrolase [Sedimentisphaerales bacterium]|nr:hydroxyacylglutathione hydrolase [Sedimentisphaerales bacterium]
MESVVTIPACGDNFIYLYRYDKNNALAVDPCDSSLVLRNLKEHDMNLTTILITHHHWDHTGGVSDLKKKTGCEVIGSDKGRIPAIDRVVDDKQVLAIGNIEIQVIATPGHTNTSVCYYIPESNDKRKILWTGDTMFAGGCGRIMECNAQTMFDSLLRLASLADDTLVYCGHDYTLENYEFAMNIEPDNKAVKQRLQEIKQTIRAGGFTVPSTILQEKTTNIFLRSDTNEIKTALKMPDAGAVDVFAELRRRKDSF